jgi:hypothetical protein
MQVYGLRLGKTIEPGKSFTLEQLKDQLSIQLNMKSPVLAQMFVHSQTPRAGRSWQITQQSWVPSPLITYELKARENDCTIFINDNMRAVITSRAWPLADMISVMESEKNWGNLILDCNSNIGNPSWASVEKGDPQSLTGTDRRLRKRFDEVRRSLSNRLDNVLPAEELFLVYIGQIYGDSYMSFGGARGDWTGPVNLGLVLLRQEETRKGSYLWVRVGICHWRGPLDQLPLNPIKGKFCVA